jgi:asparaginyl-tRNA synthetase
LEACSVIKMELFRINNILQIKADDQEVEVRGWVRTRRDSKSFSFLELNDGSCLANLQIIADDTLENYEQEILKLSTGCSISVQGVLVQSPAKGQKNELKANKVYIYGWAPVDSYPLQKKRHSSEFLRTIPHLRVRTNSIGAMARIRSSLSQAVHTFFKENDFFYIHTPIITTSDCEGAGEMFSVTSFDLNRLPVKDKKVDFNQDFFNTQAGLTVSGQLEAEAYAQALGRVYTFGPTFRAENSNTSRHLAEFWMIEPEIAFCDLDEDIKIAESFLKYLLNHSLEECSKDLELFGRFVDKGLIERLQKVVNSDFCKITYTEAIKILEKSDHDFEYPVKWGIDLQSEHERYLTEVVFKRPVVVKDYPAAIKPFYMRLSDDQKTVAAMDILFPNIGEIVGGSQREERLDVLKARMLASGVSLEDYQWYLDLRQFGTVPHAGFGLGFERIIQFITGLANIRDVIPFPRTPGSA